MEVEIKHQPVSVESGEALGTTPAAWIGCRDDFEAEQRYGQWIDVSQEPRAVLGAVRQVIDRTPADRRRRWDICATRGLGGWTPSEQEGLPVVMRIADGVSAFGEHYGGLASALGADSAALRYDRYQVSYLGSWITPRAFVEQVVSESDWQQAIDQLPSSMRPYVAVDHRALLRDAKRELTFVDHAAGVWVYDPRVW